MPEPLEDPQWYSVRCVFQLPTDGDEFAYQERVTLWHADSVEEAFALAEAEAAEYVEALDLKYLGLAQSFHLASTPKSGGEVFSLIDRVRLTRSNTLQLVSQLAESFSVTRSREAIAAHQPGGLEHRADSVFAPITLM